MPKQDHVVKLLLIEDSVDEAEQLISVLRNGGIAVRPTRADSADSLAALLDTQTPDIIIVNPESKAIKLAEVASIAGLGGRDIAVIVVVKQPNEASIIAAFADGARALALRNRADHVQSIVKREFESLIMRRSVRRLESALRETERRCDALLDSSRDPIAYVHEGMHVRANRAYLEMFGYEEFEDIESMSLLDMIGADDAEDFKTLLKKLSKGEKPPQRLNLKAQRADGTTFDAVMEFAEANFEGEPCQQISFRIQSENADLARELDELRSKDLVTELYNRQYGLNELGVAVAAAASGAHDRALLILEPDNFKRLLDTVGLGNADIMLGDMAGVIREHLKESDIAVRLGEHTFVSPGAHTFTVEVQDLDTGAIAHAEVRRIIATPLAVDLAVDVPACGLEVAFKATLSTRADVHVSMSPADKVVEPLVVGATGRFTALEPGAYTIALAAEDERATGPICERQVSQMITLTACPCDP